MLTPENLLRDFGGRADVSRQAVRTLFDALGNDDSPAIERWMPFFGRWAGRAIDKLPQHLARLAARHGIATSKGTVPFSSRRKLGQSPDSPRLLFALQSYYALLVKLLARQFGDGEVDYALPGNPFSWCESAISPAVGQLIERLAETCSRYRAGDCPDFRLDENGTVPLDGRSQHDCDLFKPLYQDLFPRPLRRQLGEYYTPDWLAEHVLDQVGYRGEAGQRLLDPACGSGTFLMLALRRSVREGEGETGRRGERERRREGEGEKGTDIVARASVGAAVEMPRQRDLFSSSSPPLPLSPSPSRPLAPIVGFDLNPLAVMTARANYLITLAELMPGHEPVEAPIYLYDSILGRGEAGDCPDFRVSENGTVPFDAEQPFDFVVGNPPWIAWDNLPDEDRQATKPLWERYGLFSLSGNDARHGGGKKDLSMLMLYATADRYLKSGGRLGMVITQTLFQTKGAGDGFRRFRLGQDGPPLRVLRVDDMVALRPFGDAANWTSTIVLEKGAATEYPVPYFKWEGERGEGRGERERRNAPLCCSARPIDPSKPTSPWLVLPQEQDNSRGPTARGASLSPLPSPLSPLALPADYVAHLGANSGGANGVYWVEVLGECDGGVLIRNLAARGKHSLDVVEQLIEPDLLYPLLRWGDVARYSAVPAAHLLLVQDPATRSGIDENIMRGRYPRTLAYLERFRDLLASRAAYRRYQQGGPFYAMYNVGPYTVAPIKVVWRRMDRQINAAVVERSAGVSMYASRSARGPGAENRPHAEREEYGRPMIPQETCVLVACDSSDEAHYLCAMLNSEAVNEIVAAQSVRGGKGFGTPGMFDFLPLRRYRPDDPRQVELASLSRQLHAASLDELQHRLDELAKETLSGCGLWGVMQYV